MFVPSLIPAFFWKIVVTKTSISGPNVFDKFARVKFPLDRLDRKNSLRWKPNTPLYSLNGRRVCEIVSFDGEKIYVPPVGGKRFKELCRVLRG